MYLIVFNQLGQESWICEKKLIMSSEMAKWINSPTTTVEKTENYSGKLTGELLNPFRSVYGWL